MRQEASQVLEKAIFDGTFAPGEQIYEAEVAKQLQLGRVPIREALLQLEKESLKVRGVLEVVALRLAREKATPRQVQGLAALQKKMLAALDQNKLEDAIPLDFEFHRAQSVTT